MQVFLSWGPQSEWGAQNLFLDWPKTEGVVDRSSGLQLGSPQGADQHLSSSVRLHLPPTPLQLLLGE